MNVSANSPLFHFTIGPQSQQGIPIKYSLFTDYFWLTHLINCIVVALLSSHKLDLSIGCP